MKIISCQGNTQIKYIFNKVFCMHRVKKSLGDWTQNMHPPHHIMLGSMRYRLLLFVTHHNSCLISTC
jgi:hypothetical protein